MYIKDSLVRQDTTRHNRVNVSPNILQLFDVHYILTCFSTANVSLIVFVHCGRFLSLSLQLWGRVQLCHLVYTAAVHRFYSFECFCRSFFWTDLHSETNLWILTRFGFLLLSTQIYATRHRFKVYSPTSLSMFKKGYQSCTNIKSQPSNVLCYITCMKTAALFTRSVLLFEHHQLNRL